MLTKGKIVKYLVVVVALLAVLACCLTSCSDPAVKDVKYVDGSLTKAVYNEGDTFDCAGAKLTVTYEDGTTKTVDVTATMTGTVVLKGVGEKDIAVSYTDEDGVSYTAYIPVTVVNTVKDNAIAGLRTDAVAAANLSDKGVLKLIGAYTALINDAATDEVAGLVEDFSEDVKEYVEKRDEVVAFVNSDENLANLYEQYKNKAKVEQANAIALLNTATDVSEFDEILEAYTSALAKLELEQKFYEGDYTPGEEGQIWQKIDLLNKIEVYRDIISENKDNALDVAKQKFYAEGYNKLADLDKYVYLAIDLSEVAKKVDEVYFNYVRTPIDDIYDALRDEKVEFVNGELLYKPFIDETANMTVLPTETIAKTLKTFIAAKLEEARALFGDAKVDEKMGAYHPVDAFYEDYTINLVTYRDNLYNAYDALIATQNAAKDVVAAINAIKNANTADVVAYQQAVMNAWNALKTWNDANGVLGAIVMPNFDTLNTTVASIAYDQLNEKGIFVFGLDADKKAVVADNWDSYAMDKEFVVTYMIPNIDDLFVASIVGERLYVEGLVASIKNPIIYSTDLTVDAKASIEAARAAYNNYAAKYADLLDNQTYFPVNADGAIAMKATIEKAEAEYQAIVDAANALIAEIKALKNAADITIADYISDGKDGALKIAYANYIKFTKEINHNYNDVIEVDGVEAKLLDCVKAYIALAWKEAKEVSGKMTITKALMEYLDKTNAETETDLRAGLVAVEKAQLEVLAQEEYDNANVDELLLISDFENAKLNLDEKAAELAKAIEAYYNANK